MSDDGFHEITALRSQLATVTKERDDSRAALTAAEIRLGGVGTEAWGKGYEYSRGQALHLVRRMVSAARDVAKRDKECERMHLHAATALEAVGLHIEGMRPADAA